MRAFHVRAYGLLDSHCVEEIASPGMPGPNEVLIRTHAIALNFPDLLMLQGKYQVRHETPFVPGRDAAGVITAVGAGVSRLREGDHVMCQVAFGAWAEEIIAPAARCYAMPSSASFAAAAAMITPYNTAYVALAVRGKLQPGEVALVTGASGSVGTALIQLARSMGAFVVATVSSEHKADYVRSLGADSVIVTAGLDLKRGIREGVLAATAGREANVVCDTVGGELFAAGLRALGFDGRMIVIGFAGAQIPEVRVNYLLMRNLAVLGAPLDVHFDERPELMRLGINLIGEYYSAGSLRPTIRSVLPFERFPDALQQAADASTPGRVVVECISDGVPRKDVR